MQVLMEQIFFLQPRWTFDNANSLPATSQAYGLEDSPDPISVAKAMGSDECVQAKFRDVEGAKLQLQTSRPSVSSLQPRKKIDEREFLEAVPPFASPAPMSQSAFAHQIGVAQRGSKDRHHNNERILATAVDLKDWNGMDVSNRQVPEEESVDANLLATQRSGFEAVPIREPPSFRQRGQQQVERYDDEYIRVTFKVRCA